MLFLSIREPPADLKVAWDVAPVILDVGGKTDGYMIPPSGGAGMKFGTGLHKVETSDADWNRDPVEGEGEAIRNLFAPPIARIEEYRVTEIVTCAYTFTKDETFFAHEAGKCLVISACSGHGYKFGAAVGRCAAKAVESGDVDSLKAWLRAEVAWKGRAGARPSPLRPRSNQYLQCFGICTRFQPSRPGSTITVRLRVA